MSRARGRHGTGRAPELTPEQIQEFGIDERDIPSGIAHNDKNPVVQHEKPKVAEPLAEFRGMMAHGVPPEGSHYPRDPRLTGQVGRVHVKPVDIPESPVPVPVYIVEASGGSRALMHTAMKHITAPAVGSEPVQICGQDTKRRSVRILNEGGGTTPKGCRIGQLNDLAWDSENNTIVGGAFLPPAMVSYLEIRTQGPLYVVSMDSNPQTVDVIIEMEIAGAA